MTSSYSIESYSPGEIANEYGNLWATINKYFPDLKDERKAIIASLVLGTCHSCHNDSTGCQCWNDE